MNPELIELLERFQTTIVGALGFIGVIWTMRANARTSTTEHRLQIETKRQALRRVLAAEFRSFSSALRTNVEAAPPDKEPRSVGRPHRILLKDVTTELGILDLGEIDAVANAIISLEGMDQFLEYISSQQSGVRIIISSDSWEDYRYIASTTADALELALKVLGDE